MDTQIQTKAVHAASPDIGPRPASRPATPPAAQEVQADKPARPEINRQTLEAATRKVQAYVEAKTSELQFAVDDTTGVQVVRVFDKSTKELIRQIPSQEMVDMAAALERLQGLLLKQKA